MATKGTDKSSHGVKIDSTLIPTASGDVQDELSVLGVSVYNQEDFEARVLHQIDTEVQRRNTEQQKSFLIKEYNSVQSELKATQVELKNISKTIAGLLSQPLSHVVLKLRELRAGQEVKRKQITSLQAREQSLLRRLSGKEDPLSSAQPLDQAQNREGLSERQRLIQTGQITPFDTQPDSSHTASSQHQSSIESLTQHEQSSASTPSHTSLVTVTHGNRLDNVTIDSLVGPSNSDSAPTWGMKKKRPSPTIQLSNESFDGLFTQPPPTKTVNRSEAKSGRSRKGKDKAKSSHSKRASPPSNDIQSTRHHSPNGSSSLSSASSLHNTSAPPTANGESSMDEHSTGHTPRLSDMGGQFSGNHDDLQTSISDHTPLNGEGVAEEWLPSIEELENFDSEESYESEYYTDDELGGAVPQHKKKQVLRPLSNDDLDSEDDDHVTSRKRKKGRGRSKKYSRDSMDQKKHLDDGDEQLYRMRVSEMSMERGESPNDMVFEGGLRIPGSIWNRLYRYQQTGVKWLWELHCQQAGGIVGDEMGLGKTIQMIAFLAGLQISNLRSHTTRELGLGPCLIVCPATVMQQWVSEFHSWWAPFRVAILHDTGTFSGDKRVLVDRIVQESGVLVTTYAGIRIYQDLLLRHKWDYVVLDEGHKIRNPDAEITLACKQFPTPHRIILSGSPMQNNLRELWSLFDFVFPGKLGTLPVFMEQFSVPITMGGYVNATQVQVQSAYRCACVLRDTINPYLLRRLKADVKVQLPNKNEQVLFCRLTDYQHDVYGDFLKGSEVERALAGRKQVFSALMTLRKLCNHPDLVTNDYSEQVTPGKGSKGRTNEGQSAYNLDEDKDTPKTISIKKLLSSSSTGEEVYGYYKRSGKMIVVRSLLKLWREQGHRALLFSQSKMMLDIFEVFVAQEGYSYVRMDGGTQISVRQPLVKRFNEDSSIFVFLLTTRVGGLGVNLTGANRVILYDPDWNPSTDTQARERAWRIGQTRNVTIYRLLTSGTIEEKIYHRQIFKQFLTNRVLKDPRQRRFFKTNDIYDLFTLDTTAREGSTETSAIFAGTGSEVIPQGHRAHTSPSKKRSHGEPTRRRRRRRSSSSRKQQCTSLSSRAESLPTAPALEERQESASVVSLPWPTAPGGGGEGASASDRSVEVPVEDKGDNVSASMKDTHSLSNVASASQAHSSGAAATGEVGVVKKAKKKKKKKKKKRRERTLVDGGEVEGVEHSCVYEPGSEDEESSQHQDDFILKKLFKKTGVHSAMKHDMIMDSADPDYAIVEAEANKVAQSAVRAMKASRRQCQTGGRWGRPTWTGSSGLVGAPGTSGIRRFGESSGPVGLSPKKQKHFDGEDAGTSLSQTSAKGSLHTSSSVLLAKMRSRNANRKVSASTGGSSREVQAADIHTHKHSELLKEMRDFIATQCRVDGQALTSEILEKFSNRLPRGDTTLFRSLLLEICNFSRHLGDGLWSLKPEFR